MTKLYVDSIVKENYMKYTRKEYLNSENLKVEKYSDGIILPVNKYYNPYKTLCGSGGVLDKNGIYIDISSQNAENMSKRVYGKYKYKNVEKSDEKVIYLNHFIHHWGHYLIDVIGRLWYVLKNDISEYKIAYTCRLGKEDEIRGNYLELLELLGIKKEQLIMVNKVTQFKEVIVPESSIYPGKFYYKEYVEIFDEIVKNANVSDCVPDKKIYCSRKLLKAATNKEIGENKLEDIYNENGYESAYFEKLSVKEQIRLINSSREIVAVSGTLLHNLVFAKNPVKVTILNKTYKLNLHQFMINELSDADVSFVDINISPMPILYGFGPFIMKITNNFISYCQDNNIKINGISNNSLKMKEIIWFYYKYIISYRGKFVKDTDLSFSELRKFYESKKNEIKDLENKLS